MSNVTEISQTTLLEIYNPKVWDDLVLPKNVKSSIENTTKVRGYRLLLHSSPGTGKTTTARLLSKDDNKLYLSGSNDFTVDTLRSRLIPFVSSMTMGGKNKTVIIDEFENIRNAVQDSFKVTLDQAKDVNFIFITNEIEKVNDAIQSRCTKFDYDFVNNNLDEHKANYTKYVASICKYLMTEHGVKATSGGVQMLIKNNFPDFRHVLVVLDQIVKGGLSIDEESVSLVSDNGKQLIKLYELIENNNIQGEILYKELVQYRGNEKDAFMSLGEPFFKYLNDKGLYDKTIHVATVMSKYYDSYQLSINKFVTFLACINELKILFR